MTGVAVAGGVLGVLVGLLILAIGIAVAYRTDDPARAIRRVAVGLVVLAVVLALVALAIATSS